MTDPVIEREMKLANEKLAWDEKERMITAARKRAGHTIISGIDIPFSDLVMLLVKLAFAAIPAAIIIGLIWSIIAAFAGGLLGSR